MSATKYAELANRLGREIRDGHYGPGVALPTIRELMSRNGYSMATVTRAISILEQQGLVRRLRGKGIFVNPVVPGDSTGIDEISRPPSALAQLHISVFCRRHRDLTAGNMWWGQVIRGAEAALAAAGMPEARLRMFPVDEDTDPSSLIQRSLGVGANAVLNLGDNWSPAQLAGIVSELDRHDLPMVMLWSGLPRPVCTHSVDVDSRLGIRLVMAHLQKLGHTRFAFAGLAGDHAWVEERRQAFLETLRPGDSGCTLVYHSARRAAGRRALRRALKNVTAVVAANDEVAEWVIQVATEAGRSIPADLSVSGFDDDFRYRYLDLTTVNPDLERLGREAIELLARLRAGDFKDRRVHVQVRPALTVRHSTGPTTAGKRPGRK